MMEQPSPNDPYARGQWSTSNGTPRSRSGEGSNWVPAGGVRAAASMGSASSSTPSQMGFGPASGTSEAGMVATDKLTEKACKKCRVRKVKCDRRWPRCARCTERGDECDFGSMIPAAAIQNDDIPRLEARIEELEDELDRLRSWQSTEARSVALAIQNAFLQGKQNPDAVYGFFGSARHPGESGAEWRLARSVLATALCLHLLDTFFTSCCAYLPVFSSWHSRLASMHENINRLDPATQVALGAFCAMGARASPHSALLGIFVDKISTSPPPPIALEAGERREQGCLAIQAHTIQLCSRLGIASLASVLNLETLLVQMQMLLFEEIYPRRSRSVLRLALGQFKDLLDSPMPESEKVALVQATALPLFLGDALIASYIRAPPLIVHDDLLLYFSRVDLSLATFERDDHDLARVLDQYIPRFAGQAAPLTHASLVQATTTLACWLALCQREFALLATQRVIAAPLNYAQVYRLWGLMDQIHASARRIQHLLVESPTPPEGCGSDGCSDLHLRFDTRLDRDLMDLVHLVHVYIETKLEEKLAYGTEATAICAESEKRVRASMRLVAFYSQLYVTSSDKHMCFHLVWQLELLPNWTSLVVQRYGEVPGPQFPELEVTETELDWFIKGLKVAAFYHPVAKARLLELEQWRRAPLLPTMEH